MLEILDTAGTEQFQTMKDLYIRKGQGFILVFSLVSKSTFYDLESLASQIRKVKDTEEIPMVLVGNKCDLGDKIIVSNDEAQELADTKLNGVYYEASAKTRVNIDELFEDIAMQVIQVYPPRKPAGCVLL
eukprot:TRINITY_DN1107_c0_g1_i4.p1 TRINITY_DN1107_c0_g1~~TRINITY_DN1107_c0_g1_i4.p1  ORF type:complete len:130 (-),score=19.83 TRINITY_DN1107_c0_g1_i4:70-459(-)